MDKADYAIYEIQKSIAELIRLGEFNKAQRELLLDGWLITPARPVTQQIAG